MSFLDSVTFVVAVNNPEVCERNLLASPCLRGLGDRVRVQKGFPSAAAAYNDGIEHVTTELIIFAHQDMYLPAQWLSQVEEAICRLRETDPNWGVLGCWGTERSGRRWGHVYSNGWGVLGEAFERPMPVQTLDEIILILRKSSGLRFDPRLPGFHFYGTDICLRAAHRGMTSYAVSAFCVHNTRQLLWLPEDFYEGYRHIKRTWRDQLPIETPCIRITRFDQDMLVRRFKRVCRQLLGDRRRGAARVSDPRQLLEGLDLRGWAPSS